MSTALSMICYTDLYKTEFGGRQAPQFRYHLGFESLLKIDDVEFVVYSWHKDMDRLYKIAKSKYGSDSKKLNKVHIIEFDLYKSPLYDTIVNIRKKEPKNSFRSIDVQYAKFITLNETIKNFPHEYTYYIDIGLSSTALFPNKYITNKKGMHQYSEVSLFNTKWLNNMNKLSSNNKLTVFKMDNSPEFHVESRIARSKYLIIGGMFGGKTETTQKFSNDVLSGFHQYVKEKNKLPPEESMMTKIHTEDRDNFNDIVFQVWNHEDSGDVFKKIIKGKKMFYNTFEELNQ